MGIWGFSQSPPPPPPFSSQKPTKLFLRKKKILSLLTIRNLDQSQLYPTFIKHPFLFFYNQCKLIIRDLSF